jgi:6-pyruvoyltetrahydropterin/6-carboxytetrahydropterin synthase
MPDTTCTKVLRFCAGHRLMHHEGRCAQLHGHNYEVEITAEPVGSLDGVGRVVDFSVIKEKVGAWIDDQWDHGFLVHERDLDALWALREFAEASGVPQRVVHLPVNPTAENMAHHLFTVATTLLRDDGVQIRRVRLWETPTCYAEVTRA